MHQPPNNRELRGSNKRPARPSHQRGPVRAAPFPPLADIGDSAGNLKDHSDSPAARSREALRTTDLRNTTVETEN